MADFLQTGTGGHFKGNDPNVPVERLVSNWVKGSSVLYLGKAGPGKMRRRGLRKRIGEYLNFGSGLSVGHSGGRFIWQLKNSDSLVLCWQETEETPELLESSLLHDFVAEHGTLPFANLRR